METTTETRTDASYVYELMLKVAWRWDRFGRYDIYAPTSDVLALHQDWTRHYSTGQDVPA